MPYLYLCMMAPEIDWFMQTLGVAIPDWGKLSVFELRTKYNEYVKTGTVKPDRATLPIIDDETGKKPCLEIFNIYGPKK